MFTKGRLLDDLPLSLKSRRSRLLSRERSHFEPDPQPVVTELPLQKIKKEPPKVDLSSSRPRPNPAKRSRCTRRAKSVNIVYAKNGRPGPSVREQAVPDRLRCLYELTPAEKRSLAAALADACEIDMRGQVDANTTRGVLVLRLDARVHQMVEEQRGYDDTRALPQQSSMFGEHAEAPVAEPLFGSVEERQQEDERVAAVVVPARSCEKEGGKKKLDRRRKTRAERRSTPRPSGSRRNASKPKTHTAKWERKEREKQEMLERKAAEKAEKKRRKAEKKEENV